MSNTTAVSGGKKLLERGNAPAQDSPAQRMLFGAGNAKRARHRAAKRAAQKLFAERLCAAMTQAGLSASQLARRIWGTEKTRRGAAKNRDRVGAYMKGLAYPNPASMKKLAEAIGIPVEELVPPARKRSPPKTVTLPAEGPLSINVLPTGQARLLIDRVMPLKLALEIAQQIDALGADTAAPEGSPRLGSVV